MEKWGVQALSGTNGFLWGWALYPVKAGTKADRK